MTDINSRLSDALSTLLGLSINFGSPQHYLGRSRDARLYAQNCALAAEAVKEARAALAKEPTQ